MSQISLSEASDLFQKLFAERTPLTAFLVSPSRARIRLNGFIVGATRNEGLFIGDRLPPDTPLNWINVFPFDEGGCVFTYGENREITEEVRLLLNIGLGESAMSLRFVVTNETLILFFTL
jgi:hypothetical protein